MVQYKDEYPDGIDPNFWTRFIAPNVKTIKGNICERCGTDKNIDVHHTDYIKEVNINTLKLLCRKCHKKEHIIRN